MSRTGKWTHGRHERSNYPLQPPPKIRMKPLMVDRNPIKLFGTITLSERYLNLLASLSATKLAQPERDGGA